MNDLSSFSRSRPPVLDTAGQLGAPRKCALARPTKVQCTRRPVAMSFVRPTCIACAPILRDTRRISCEESEFESGVVHRVDADHPRARRGGIGRLRFNSADSDALGARTRLRQSCVWPRHRTRQVRTDGNAHRRADLPQHVYRVSRKQWQRCTPQLRWI